MKRIYLFEFMDQDWYPRIFRRIQADYLQFVATMGSGHEFLIPLFERALRQSETRAIIDLCSGGSGPWVRLQNHLAQAGLEVTVTLTDKYPDPDVLQKFSDGTQSKITYLAEPVDALHVPRRLAGMRTMFEGFHHFKPAEASAILQAAAEARQPVGFFEAGLKAPYRLPLLLLAPITTLLAYFCMTPFIKPPRLSRFLWTYLLPIVPLVTCWDGVVSLLRVYSPQALQELCSSICVENYAWETGLAPTGTPVFDFIYLVGYPVN